MTPTLKREPAVIIAAVAAVIQGLVIFATNDTAADTSLVLPIVTMLAGIIIRSRVTPVK